MKVRSRRKQARQKQIYMTAAVFAGVIVLGVLLPRLFSVVTTFALQPIHSLTAWIATSESVLPVYVRDRRALSEEIEELEQALSERSGAEVSRQYLIAENEQLRSLFDQNNPRRTLAAVIARPNELPYDVLQLDQGSDAGVEVGSPVFINDRVAIGLVSFVSKEYSLVQLISSPDFRSTVFIGGPNIIAELVGQGGGIARVRVPQGIPLAVGNTVSLPSISTAVLGQVVSIENVPTQAEQYGYVTMPIPLSSLHLVSIGRPSEINYDPASIEAAIESSLEQALLVSGLASSSFSVATSTTEVNTSTSSSIGL